MLLQSAFTGGNGYMTENVLRLLNSSDKARLYVTKRGHVGELIDALKAIHPDLSSGSRSGMRVVALDSDEVAMLIERLRVLINVMYENLLAKESAASGSLVEVIASLWRTAMMKENAQLRRVVLQVLLTFTSSCTKAGEAMTKPFQGASWP